MYLDCYRHYSDPEPSNPYSRNMVTEDMFASLTLLEALSSYITSIRRYMYIFGPVHIHTSEQRCIPFMCGVMLHGNCLPEMIPEHS